VKFLFWALSVQMRTSKGDGREVSGDREYVKLDTRNVKLKSLLERVGSEVNRWSDLRLQVKGCGALIGA